MNINLVRYSKLGNVLEPRLRKRLDDAKYAPCKYESLNAVSSVYADSIVNTKKWLANRFENLLAWIVQFYRIFFRNQKSLGLRRINLNFS